MASLLSFVSSSSTEQLQKQVRKQDFVNQIESAQVYFIVQAKQADGTKREQRFKILLEGEKSDTVASSCAVLLKGRG